MSVDDDHDQDLEALETLSLTDFPLTEDANSCSHDHQNRPASPSSPKEDLFEFFKGELSSGRNDLEDGEQKMSHAEDMIIGGKLIPINDQQPRPHQDHQTRSNNNNKKHAHRKRSESMRELKSSNNKGPTASQLVRNSHSLDYKKMSKNSKLNYESTAENHRNSLSTKTPSSRWADLKLGPLRVPQEMDLRDIRNRQNVQNTSKSLFPSVESAGERLSVNHHRAGGSHHRKTSWGVLGILSCKSSINVAVTMPLS